jgi:hypothetical protein
VATLVNVEFEDSVPQPGEHAFPFCVRVQLTPLPEPSLLTVGVKYAVALMTKLAEVGTMDTVIAGTVILAACDFVVSDIDVAVSVTLRSFVGEAFGAL